MSANAGNTSSTVLATLQDVSFGYGRQANQILHRVSLNIHRGEFVGLYGDNGTGKSTIVRLFTGLLRPRAGKVLLLGQPVSARHHTPQVGYCGEPTHFDGGAALPADLPLSIVLGLNRSLVTANGVPGEYVDRWERDLMLTDPELRKQRIGTLSNGQRKRTLTCLALSKRPLLLLADEQSEGLDPSSRKLILRAMRRAVKEDNMAGLYITHRREELVMLADRVFELAQQRLHERAGTGFSCEVTVDDHTETQQNLSATQVIELVSNTLTNAERNRSSIDVRINTWRPGGEQ